ncbi:hypothetical protein TBLA_0B04340 [Henningerozyma blattae CBS 6284]|uniref:TECPR1-like DysF domain-containing protein n=1 Tax=Henningerozyma blattae (strain ATCC 34711 / CBS 6284 / DSM 70876 / NBRC 10599 / NRRL Y-10934 / UCD 77-7) TaxID=1071380 RepID=I2GYR9_HENB6|nr:hypothetical protein TBLA_0B04340 [Tetrapisispora blattae CBS 6284]CCH59271.1 hypothetical protein TBLA_0B04340 [Tetrapisispora blattae CBS 6284]
MAYNKQLEAKLEQKYIHNKVVTDPEISAALARIYPLLIIINTTLDNILWICNDHCLPFIYLLAIEICLTPLDHSRNIKNITSYSYRMWSILQTWFALMSLVFLSTSLCYYIVTVYNDLKKLEAPTSEDILIALNSMTEKLKVLKVETLRGYSINMNKLIVYFFIFIPIQIFLNNSVFSEKYLRLFALSFLFFHSSWVQTTIKIFWRLTITRYIYFAFYYLLNPFAFKCRWPSIKGLNIYISKISPNAIADLPFPESFEILSNIEEQIALLKTYPRIDTNNSISLPSNRNAETSSTKPIHSVPEISESNNLTLTTPDILHKSISNSASITRSIPPVPGTISKSLPRSLPPFPNSAPGPVPQTSCFTPRPTPPIPNSAPKPSVPVLNPAATSVSPLSKSSSRPVPPIPNSISSSTSPLTNADKPTSSASDLNPLTSDLITTPKETVSSTSEITTENNLLVESNDETISANNDNKSNSQSLLPSEPTNKDSSFCATDLQLPNSSLITPSNGCISVIDITIMENQRKWRALGWSGITLKYERANFTINLDDETSTKQLPELITNQNLQAIVSPLELQNTMNSIPDWKWLDNGWVTFDWDYMDTDWNYLGKVESLECFTRSRKWKRRIYSIKTKK